MPMTDVMSTGAWEGTAGMKMKSTQVNEIPFGEYVENAIFQLRQALIATARNEEGTWKLHAIVDAMQTVEVLKGYSYGESTIPTPASEGYSGGGGLNGPHARGDDPRSRP